MRLTFQLDPVLNKIQMDLQRLIYRYLTQAEVQSKPEEKSPELKISLMSLSQVHVQGVPKKGIFSNLINYLI